MLKAAFLFLAGGADSQVHRAVNVTPAVELTSIGVKDYDDAVAVAKELAAAGYGAIELCGGFGNKGTAVITDAVEGKLAVGVVRFDIHPGLGNKSGDELF